MSQHHVHALLMQQALRRPSVNVQGRPLVPYHDGCLQPVAIRNGEQSLGASGQLAPSPNFFLYSPRDAR